jgi:hypothetical protein
MVEFIIEGGGTVRIPKKLMAEMFGYMLPVMQATGNPVSISFGFPVFRMMAAASDDSKPDPVVASPS